MFFEGIHNSFASTQVFRSIPVCIVSCLFIRCSSNDIGGAIRVLDSRRVLIKYCLFSRCTAWISGGAIHSGLSRLHLRSSFGECCISKGFGDFVVASSQIFSLNLTAFRLPKLQSKGAVVSSDCSNDWNMVNVSMVSGTRQIPAVGITADRNASVRFSLFQSIHASGAIRVTSNGTLRCRNTAFIDVQMVPIIVRNADGVLVNCHFERVGEFSGDFITAVDCTADKDYPLLKGNAIVTEMVIEKMPIKYGISVEILETSTFYPSNTFTPSLLFTNTYQDYFVPLLGKLLRKTVLMLVLV